jgi:hypothetical protein
MTMNRETMLSDLAQYGIKDLEALDDAGVKKMHDKYYPPIKVCGGHSRECGECLICGFTPEQVEDAIDAVIIPEVKS